MSDDIRRLIPSFGKPKENPEISNAISVLRKQGLLPKEIESKKVLDTQDQQLVYIASVYRNLVISR